MGASASQTGLSPSVEPVPVSPPDGASIPSASHERLLKIMRRFRAREERNDDIGPWLGIGEIRRAHGGDKAEVRALLLDLADTGEIEALVCSSGTFWCLTRPTPTPLPAPGPMVFVLQRMTDPKAGSRGVWFDAEAFDTAAKAFAALQWRQWEERARIAGEGGSGYTGRHPQAMRVVHLVCDAQSTTGDAR